MSQRTRISAWPALLAGLWACTDAPPPEVTTLAFTDVTGVATIDFRHTHGAVGDYHYPETFGSGVAWLDVDADGRLDLYFVDGGRLPDTGTNAGPDRATHEPLIPAGNRLYRNASRLDTVQFEDVTEAWRARSTSYGMGVAAADANGDGLVDLFLSNVGPNELLVQREHTFHRLSIPTDSAWSTGCAFTDLDLDGDLDLAVVNYVHFDASDLHACQRGSIRTYCDPGVYEPMGDALFRNTLQETGEFSLVEITQDARFGAAARSLGIGIGDLDLDGDSEIYVANDGQHNFLYRNDSIPGRILLLDVSLTAGTRFNSNGMAEAGMGVGIDDLDADGYPDLVVANFSRETHTLYQHTGKGLSFRDVTREAGLARASFLPLGFGVSLFDADLDGDVDLFSAHGHVLDKAAEIDASLTYAQPDGLFLNEAGRFEDHSTALGVAYHVPRPSRSSAGADYDGDGDVDLIVTSVGGRPRLLRNDLDTDRHWLVVELQTQLPGNRAGWGSRVEVEAPGSRQTRQLQTGGSYLSAPPPRLHFGLGRDVSKVDITVHWPGGAAETWHQLPVDEHVQLVQGAAAAPLD